MISFENADNWPPLKLENQTIYHYKIFQTSYELKIIRFFRKYLNFILFRETAEILPSHKSSDFAWENPFETNNLNVKN